MMCGLHGNFARRPLMLVAASVVGLVAALPARALEVQKGEVAAIEACDKRLCGILMQKNSKGEDLKCALTKTWARSTLKGGDRKEMTWGFGDARCSIVLNVSRASIVAAVTSGKTHKFWMPPHTANCVVEEDGQLKALKATVEPKIEFKDGKAEKIWINLRQIDGSASIAGWLSAAAHLTDKVGIFHHQMIKSVNRHIFRECPEKYPQTQAAKPAAKKK